MPLPQVKLYEIRTYGCLSDKHGQSVCCLIEVKSARRNTEPSKISCKCAQMTACILNEPDDYVLRFGWYVHTPSHFSCVGLQCQLT